MNLKNQEKLNSGYHKKRMRWIQKIITVDFYDAEEIFTYNVGLAMTQVSYNFRAIIDFF